MHDGIVASNLRRLNRNTLQGTVDLEVTAWRIKFCGCLWHRRDGREWIAFPGREWTGQDGRRQFANLIDWTDDTWRKRFQQAALDAIHDLERAR